MNQLSPTVRSARGYVSFFAVTAVVLAFLGGFVSKAVDSEIAALGAVVLVGVGGLLVSIATVAWSVRLGMESVERPESA